MSILNLLRGLNVEVDPIKNKVTITGLRFLYVCRDLEKYIGAKMLYSILDNVSYSRLVFSMFYLPDFYHAINTLLTDPKFKRRIRSGRELLAIRTELEKIPLIANIKIINETEPNAIPKLDKSKLNKIFNNIKLFDYQDKFIDDCIWKSKLLGLNGYLLDAGAGTGKAQPLYSKVKIPGGWTTMGEIQPGDYVETDDGKYAKVLGTFPQGLRDVYEITFKDGRKVRCDENHLWKVHFYDWKLPNTCDDGYRIKSTLELLKEHKRVRNQGKYLKIPLVTGIDRPSYRDIDLPLDPYFLGAVLGDGGISCGVVHIHTPDEEIIDKIKENLIPECKITKSEYIESSCPAFTVIRSSQEYGKKNQVKEILKDLGLMGKRAWEKSIPEEYFAGSYYQRLELLRGLLDTDGCASEGSIEFSSTSETLAKQVQELVWSIGGICKITQRQTYFTHKGVKKPGRVSYRLNIRHQFPESLFHVSRKRANVSNDSQYCRHGIKLAITDIKYIGKEETKCISILSEKKLYLTDNYIVTHNTILSISLAEMLDSDTIIVISPKKAVNDVWDETITRIYKEPQPYSMSLPVLHGPSKPAGFDIDDRFIVCHYESLGKLNDYLNSIKIPNKRYFVVLDECHSLNSHNSERSIQFRELVSKIDPIFCLWMSGTPIKALGTETMTMFATIDRLFDKSVYKSFLKVFGISGVYAISVMAHRLQLVRSEIKTNGSGVEQYTHKVKVTLQNGADYTLKTISNKMIDYVKERKEYYQKNAKKYEDDFFSSIEVYRSCVVKGRGDTSFFRADLEDYLSKAKTLHNGYSPTDPKHKQYVLECNYYEDKVIIPRLPNDVKKVFRKAKSVYKYVELTIMGEALGNILGKARSRCNADMVKQLVTDAKVISEDGEIYQSNLPDLILNAQAKTIIFTDYVEVVKETEYQLKLKGFKPISIFGETTSGNGLALQTKIFKEDSEINPLITTYKTLSEAVPLTEANRVIFLNLPFRSGTYEQAVKRANRIGQTLDVDLFEVTLDTGEEPNISTRNEDILKWSEEQVALILGKKLPEENKEILHGLIETSTIEDKIKTGIDTVTRVASKFLDW